MEIFGFDLNTLMAISGIIIVVILIRKSISGNAYDKIKEVEGPKKETSSNSNSKKVWNRDLTVTAPGDISLLVPVELQKVECWNYFLDKKPFNGIVYFVHDEKEILTSSLWDLPMHMQTKVELLSTSEEEKLKIIDYEFDIKNGVKDGACRLFDKDRNLKGDYDIKNDIKNGVERGYFKNGNLHYECFYKDNKRDGLYKQYFESGNIENEQEFKNDVNDGFYKQYSEIGILVCEGEMQGGKQTGIWKVYDKDGNLTQEIQH